MPTFRAVLATLVLAVALCGAALPVAAWAPGTAAAVDAPAPPSEEGLVLIVALPWEDLALTAARVDGRDYTRVSLPGFATTSQPGAPALPVATRVLGAPFGARITVMAEAGPAHVLRLPAPPLPVATRSLRPEALAGGAAPSALPVWVDAIVEDPAIYGDARGYPGRLAEVVTDGVMRLQRVVGVAAYPVQYRPDAGELVVYEWLRLTVLFRGTPETDMQAAPARDAPPFESLLGAQLANDEAARAWRRAAPAGGRSLPSDAGASGGASLPWTPPAPGWRLKVQGEGLYRLTYAELAASGVPVAALDLHTLQMFHLGGEVAIAVSGEADGIFDVGDAVVFYGQGLQDKYTADDVYWLTYGRSQGRRMSVRDGSPGDAPMAASFPALLHLEQNAWYIPGAAGDEHLDRWFWHYLLATTSAGASWTRSFALATPAAGPAMLRLALLGRLQYPSVNPDHHVVVSLNGAPAGETWWDGTTWRILEMPLAAGRLVTGTNAVTVTCPNDTGAGVDLVYVDWIELDYASGFVATGDELAFTLDPAGTRRVQVSGFTGADIAVYDVTDPAAVKRIDNLAVASTPQGYAVTFEDESGAPMRYRAVADAAYRSVASIEADVASDLQSGPSAGADYIVIAPALFAAQAATLAAHRASQGLRAVAVDVQDIYDAFGYGIAGAAPLRAFLAYAYAHWSPAPPSYVVLLGDGHYDPRNYAGYGRASLIPPYLYPADPWLGETAADNRYVAFVGDDALPDMMLGRISVETAAQATAWVNKIIAYETTPAAGDWRQNVIAVADNYDPQAGDFAQMSDDLLTSLLSPPYIAQKVYLGRNPHATAGLAKAAIKAGISAGALIVNYIGHAALAQWADENIFSAADVAALTNGARLPVILAMTCWDGYYVYPNAGGESLAEVITRAEGKGAVASWSPTGMGVAGGHDELDRGFLRAAFRQGARTLGQATMAGKLALWATGTHLDLLDTYLVFGDPALRLATLGADVQLAKEVEPTGALYAGDTLTYTLTVTNAGPATAHGVVITDTWPAALEAPVLEVGAFAVGAVPAPAYVWPVGDLPPGAMTTLRVRGTVRALVPRGEIANLAVVGATEVDPQPTNNGASALNTIAGWTFYLPLLRGEPD